MGRFYQTSNPQFLDFVYEPPYDLMKSVLAHNQTGYDTTVGATQLLNGLLDIKHRNTPEENENVTNIKNYYETRIDDISSRLQQNPSDYKKYLPEITNLKRQIDADRKEGDISKIEGTYNSYTAYQKELDELKKKDPKSFDAVSQQAGLNYFDKNWGGNSLKSGVWSSEEVINRPELMDAKNLVEIAKKVPAYKGSTITQTPTGGYIVTRGNTQEAVTKQQLMETVSSAIMSDPTMLSWMKQQQKFGIPGANYFNEDGSLNIGPEATNPLASMLRLGSSFEYSNTSSDYKIGEDTKRAHDLDRQSKFDLENLKHQHDLARDKAKFENDLKMKLVDDPENPVLQEMAGFLKQESIFLADPALAFTPDELNKKASTYANYFQKYNLTDAQGNVYGISPEGKKVYPTEQEKASQGELNTLFNEAAKKLNIPKQDYLDVIAVQSGQMLGSKSTKKRVDSGDGKGMWVDSIEPSERYEKAQRNAVKLLKHFKGNESGINDVIEGLAKNIEVTDMWYMPGDKTPEGNFTQGLVNALFGSGVNYETHGTDYTYYDEKGQNRKSTYAGQVDTGFFDGVSDKEAGKNIPLYLSQKYGGKPSDYMSNIQVKRDGDRMIVKFTPSVGKSGLSTSDLESGAGREQMFIFNNTKSNIDQVFKENGVYDTPAGRNWYSMSDANMSNIKKKVNMGLAYVTQGNSTKDIEGLKVRNTGRGTYEVTVDGETYDHLDYNGMQIPITNADQIAEMVRQYKATNKK